MYISISYVANEYGGLNKIVQKICKYGVIILTNFTRPAVPRFLSNTMYNWNRNIYVKQHVFFLYDAGNPPKINLKYLVFIYMIIVI